MKGLELNKIAASILLASFIALVGGFIANILYKPHLKITRGYKIDVTDDIAAPQEEANPEEKWDIAALMKNANATAGGELVKKCATCHSLEKDGPNKIGPHLWNIVGANKARTKDYSYSSVMASAGGAWDEDSLFKFLHKPSKFIPGTKMTFVGFSKPEDIANVIAYLKEFVHDK